MVSFFSHVFCKCQVPKDASGLAIEPRREQMIDQQASLSTACPIGYPSSLDKVKPIPRLQKSDQYIFIWDAKNFMT